MIGLLLIALFIWFAGPYFGFGSLPSARDRAARLIAIALVVAWWLVSAVLKRLRAPAARATSSSAAVLRQSQPEKEPPSAEAAKLRERFEEAVATLRSSGEAAPASTSLPWYVFIGAPGSGKTTALLNSGLKFPLEQRVGKAAVRGVARSSRSW